MIWIISFNHKKNYLKLWQSELFFASARLKDALNFGQLCLAELFVANVDSCEQFAVTVKFPSDWHALVFNFKHFTILNVLNLLNVNSMSVQVRNPSLKTENSFLQSDVNIYSEIISLSF
jgi:hypothetical protein